jgi:hypothetical protein
MVLEFLVAFCAVALAVSTETEITLPELANGTYHRYHTNELTGPETDYMGNQTKIPESIPACLPIERQILDT